MMFRAHRGQISNLSPLAPYLSFHIHVRTAGKEAKFWLSDEVTMARNDGFDARTIRVLLGVVEQNNQLLEDAWHVYFA